MASTDQRRQEAAYWSDKLHKSTEVSDQIHAVFKLGYLGLQAKVGLGNLIETLEAESCALRGATIEAMWRLQCEGLDVIGPTHAVVSTGVIPRTAWALECLEFRFAKQGKKLLYCPYQKP